MDKVITRIWHGKTRIEHADEYLEYLKISGIKDYKSIPGNLSVEILRRKEKDVCHFWAISKWVSVESIKLFTGEEYEKARYYPEDEKYLLEFEEDVIHCETFNF
ncbi:MAG: antibiotic biosynthesis monooxygenase [Ignavibacteria bacterium GWC2_35_8]|nr:MAG: antibiotic biosynthesis monooxygenase [Ignavibacteria bacterium GWC2_35_8]